MDKHLQPMKNVVVPPAAPHACRDHRSDYKPPCYRTIALNEHPVETSYFSRSMYIAVYIYSEHQSASCPAGWLPQLSFLLASQVRNHHDTNTRRENKVQLKRVLVTKSVSEFSQQFPFESGEIHLELQLEGRGLGLRENPTLMERRGFPLRIAYRLMSLCTNR